MAHAIFVKSTGDGDASTFAAHSDWRDTWHIVVPVDLDREQSGILLYDRFNGEAKFGSIDSSGAVKELAVWGWADAWDIIVAGNFSSKTTEDLLLYRRDTGEAKFLTTTKQGEYETLTHHEDWNTVWDIIVPGKFGGSKYTDLLLYERNTGIGKFLTTDGTGHVDVLKRHDWQSDWDIIIPGNFSSSEYTDLLFYRRSDGVAKFFKTDGAGEIIELGQHDWQANWDFIVPGNFSSSEFTDLLFYRREDGLAKFYRTDGAGDVTKMTEQTWGRVYDAVVAGDFVDGKHDDVLLYASRLNKAVGVGWRGSVDTDLQFSEFFTGDHTVMARFMLQYPIGYAGPVCAENGAGTYFIGQGNYSEGGSGAKLRIEIGSQLKTISVSDTIDGQWVHVAVVRSGNTFKVYLDGQHQSPDVTISSSDSALPTPTSTLRLGRRTDGETVDDRETQFYGLIDEVAVFARALTQAEIDDFAASDKQLEGTESDLVAAWTFASSNASGSALPAALSRPYVLQSHPGAAGRAADVVKLSPARNNKYDRKLLPRPPILLKFPLPFAEGEKWRVVQGMSSSAGTHKSFAAFALDFHSAPYPGTCNEKVLAVSAGKVVQVEDDDDEGGNFIIVELAPDVLVHYLHNVKGSSRVQKDDQVEIGDHIANIGEPECHLHLSVRNRKEPVNGGEEAVTIPWAFESFCACTPATTKASTCTSWVHHKHDVPLNDQWISWA